ncbi:MAG: archaemetzincin, partial [bacterium]
QKGNRSIFGYGTLNHRAGICSVARLYPQLLEEKTDPVTASVGLLRSMKLIAHETGHMLGLHHCAASQCVMNGINTLHEVDRQPLHLCPICLSKLAWHLRFHVAGRYQQLAHVLTKLGHTSQAAWYRRQYLRRLPSPKTATRSPDDEDALPRFRSHH